MLAAMSAVVTGGLRGEVKAGCGGGGAAEAEGSAGYMICAKHTAAATALPEPCSPGTRCR